MVQKYDLLQGRRTRRGVPMELIVDEGCRTRTSSVDLEDNGQREGRGVSASVIATAIQRRGARNVAADLAGKYVNAQVETSSSRSQNRPTSFFERQLRRKETALDDLEKQRLDIMMQNVATLPESEQGLVATAAGTASA